MYIGTDYFAHIEMIEPLFSPRFVRGFFFLCRLLGFIIKIFPTIGTFYLFRVVYASNNLVRTLLAMGEADEARKFIKNSKIHISKELVRRAEKAVQKAVPEKTDLPEEENAQINKTVNLGVKKHQFSSEKILEDELVLRMESGISVFGFPLKVYQAKGAYGRQYIIPHGRIDILAIDDKGDYYVIELKKDSGYDDAYVQTKAYVDWIQKHLAKSDQKVYGIICLNSPAKQLIEKVRNDELIKLFEYSISYSEIQ